MTGEMDRMFERVEVEAIVNPTEDVEKTKKAIMKLIPNLTSWDIDGNILKGWTSDLHALNRLYELFRGQAILDTAREKLEEGLFGEEIIIRVNRQAAYAGVVNFNEEGPMGPITITIKTNNPERLMRWLAPHTKDGVPVE